jgi:hypothetical protein
MKKVIIVFIMLLGLITYFSLTAGAADNEIKKGDMVSVCKAGKDCGKFETATKDLKNCKCGAETEMFHVLKVEGDVAVLCQCGGGCKCELSPKNPYQCSCGSPVKVVRIVK